MRILVCRFLKSSGRFHFSRLVESVQKKKIMDFLPRLVVLESKWLKERNKDDFDKYGDSYVDIITCEDFMNQLEFMSGVLEPLSKKEQEAYLSEVKVPAKEFDSLKFAVRGFPDCQKEYLETLIKFLGGEIEVREVDVIVADSGLFEDVKKVVKENRGARIVNSEWVERSLVYD